MPDLDLQLYQLQAEIAKVLASPARLRIVEEVGTTEVAYGTLLTKLGISKTNLSQHLAVLRKGGVLTVRRQGVHAHFRLRYPEMAKLCSAMRGILAERIEVPRTVGARLIRETSARRGVATPTADRGGNGDG